MSARPFDIQKYLLEAKEAEPDDKEKAADKEEEREEEKKISEDKAKLGSGTRFKNIEKNAEKSGASDPAAVAAASGIKKYGKEKMSKMAQAGKHESLLLKNLVPKK